MSRRFARCSEKTSDAWVEEKRRDLGDRQQRLLAAPRLWAGRDGAAGLPLPLDADRTMPVCASGCGNWRQSGAASATAGCTFC